MAGQEGWSGERPVQRTRSALRWPPMPPEACHLKEGSSVQVHGVRAFSEFVRKCFWSLKNGRQVLAEQIRDKL